ncbi:MULTISPECIES: hypothetical protein [unclassified Roseofilum]|uniref:hypothetical protein n=1 Tax=unclassified Roseofilum TaxID=2620099 RepID=UPI000E8F088D|nr:MULTISPECIES: hypothetical protein [unclassified Roseofilum]HBQ99034.1 hypothetical protein [Cyanobacteria bacterium UBA11691]MBP0007506.1 hypothetical protein [Roseofilum sp. Belize Diploria]MBP0012792.1 hypothetical protein [Roseofilum sp. SID3]MBP0025170.1 hypothetical protein [Roseofilum sp. SID2]MBP0028246.1 hypothetical protein [Roseofilum sp. Guam]
MQTLLSLLVSPLFLVNTIAMTPLSSSEVSTLSVDTSESTEILYGYRYNRRGGETPRGGTGRRRIMA